MLCDGDIAEMYGVSRTMIQMIRHGKRWNDEDRSFSMKDEIKRYTRTTTQIGGNRYSSQINPVETTQGRLFIILHYIGDDVFHQPSRIFHQEPTYEDFRVEHDNFVSKVNI